MAKYSMKRGGKEVGQAAVYAKPHTMSGKDVNVNTFTKRNVEPMPLDYISVGKPPKAKTNKMRGYGAATKGITVSDKMG
jgi:hypothetical protein